MTSSNGMRQVGRASDTGLSQAAGKEMKKIVWMEMLLLGASILIFRSVWTLLDSIAWAKGKVGLTMLLVAGVLATVVALRSIEALSRKNGEKGEGH